LNKFIIISACCLISFAACKKKKDEPTPEPPPPVIKTMTAKVDGAAWEMNNDTYVVTKSSSFLGFSGRTSYNPPNTTIGFSFSHSVGTMTVGGMGGFGAYFKDVNDIYFNANTGTLTITQCDTTGPPISGLIKRLKGSFSFITNTQSGKSYTITDGVIDFTKP